MSASFQHPLEMKGGTLCAKMASRAQIMQILSAVSKICRCVNCFFFFFLKSRYTTVWISNQLLSHLIALKCSSNDEDWFIIAALWNSEWSLIFHFMKQLVKISYKCKRYVSVYVRTHADMHLHVWHTQRSDLREHQSGLKTKNLKVWHWMGERFVFNKIWTTIAGFYKSSST